MPEKLSILMPVYNERYTVATLIDRVMAAVLPNGFDRELIVVNDCSTDGTAEVLKAVASRYGGVVQVYTHEANRGKGAAVRTALSKASGDICIIQDADLEYDPKDYARVLAPIVEGEADVVYGSRFLVRERVRVLYFWHSLGNRFLTLVSNMFSNLTLTDMETCYKAIRTDILKSLPIRCNRFGIEPELTAKLAKRRCRIYEVPISYRGRTYAEGKKISWWDGLKALGVIARFWLEDDLYNEQYGHQILHSLFQAQRFIGWMANCVRPYLGDSVLEVGAGLGNLSVQLLPRDRYVVSDVDPLSLSFLRNFFEHRPGVGVIDFDLGDPRSSDPHAEEFDTVVCLNVLEHVKSDDVALSNMARVLKPGGRAIILVPQGKWLYGSLDSAVDHVRRYSRDELIHRCECAGLVAEKVFSFNRAAVPGWFVNGRILHRKHFGKVQLKIFDHLVWISRRIDRFLPWPGLSLIAVASKPKGSNQ